MRAWVGAAAGWVAGAVVVAAPWSGAREAGADEAALKAAFSDYRDGLPKKGIEKLRAYVKSDPDDAEVARVLAATDDRLEAKIVAMGGEHADLLRDLQLRANVKERVQNAVDHALRWLLARQAADGHLGARDFGRWNDGKEDPSAPPSAGPGNPLYDMGVTALAVLAFEEAGYRPADGHPYDDAVRKALRWLVSAQDDEGCLAQRTSGHFIYNHAIAAQALLKGYEATRDESLLEPAKRAVAFTAVAQNPKSGWRYGIQPGDSDTSATAWCGSVFAVALRVNRAEEGRGIPAPFPVDPAVLSGIRSWVETATDPATGRGGYQIRGSGPARPTELVDAFPQGVSEAMTAAALPLRALAGEDLATSLVAQKGVGLLAALPPKWDERSGSIDAYYWYWGTRAMRISGGVPERKWRRALAGALVPHQRLDGTFAAEKGSFDPVDAWSREGGRVYMTAMCALSLAAAVPLDRRPPLPATEGPARGPVPPAPKGK